MSAATEVLRLDPLGVSHSEVKPSGQEDEARSRAEGGQVGAEDLLENLWTWPKTLVRSRAEEFLR